MLILQNSKPPTKEIKEYFPLYDFGESIIYIWSTRNKIKTTMIRTWKSYTCVVNFVRWCEYNF